VSKHHGIEFQQAAHGNDLDLLHEADLAVDLAGSKINPDHQFLIFVVVGLRPNRPYRSGASDSWQFFLVILETVEQNNFFMGIKGFQGFQSFKNLVHRIRSLKVAVPSDTATTALAAMVALKKVDIYGARPVRDSNKLET
jgi:hypothetical protein